MVSSVPSAQRTTTRFSASSFTATPYGVHPVVAVMVDRIAHVDAVDNLPSTAARRGESPGENGGGVADRPIHHPTDYSDVSNANLSRRLRLLVRRTYAPVFTNRPSRSYTSGFADFTYRAVAIPMAMIASAV